jgi:hypothetical protein
MVLQITVSENEWDTFVGEITRDNMANWLETIIPKYLQSHDDCEMTMIKLPATVTKIQRYNIHKLSTGQFNSASHDTDNGDRIMEIELTKKYVKDLLKDYPFDDVVPETPASQIQPVVSERQGLFNTLIGFIETNFAPEFQTFLSRF